MLYSFSCVQAYYTHCTALTCQVPSRDSHILEDNQLTQTKTVELGYKLIQTNLGIQLYCVESGWGVFYTFAAV